MKNNLSNVKQELILLFRKLKKQNWIKTKRSGDECLGNTFEDLIGKKEDNKQIADYNGIEIKSHRINTSSATTLFTKVPDYPENINSYLKENYGVKDTGINRNKLNVSVFSNKYCPEKQNSKYSYKFKIEDDALHKRVLLKVYSLDRKPIKDLIYWKYETLEKAIKDKLKCIAIVTGEDTVSKYKKMKKRPKFNKVKYSKIEFCEGFTLDKLIAGIKDGKIFADLRIGNHKSGKLKGKPHDHGTGFRIKIIDLYKYVKTQSYT